MTRTFKHDELRLRKPIDGFGRGGGNKTITAPVDSQRGNLSGWYGSTGHGDGGLHPFLGIGERRDAIGAG